MSLRKKSIIIVLTIVLGILLFIRFSTSVSPIDYYYVGDIVQTKSEISFDGAYLTSFDFYAKQKIRYRDDAAYITLYHYTLPLFNKRKTGFFDVEIDKNLHTVNAIYLVDKKDEKRIY